MCLTSCCARDWASKLGVACTVVGLCAVIFISQSFGAAIALRAKAACDTRGICSTTLPESMLKNSPCADRSTQLFYRTQSSVAVLQCLQVGGADDSLTLVFDRRNPARTWTVAEGARLLRQLDGVLDQGVPDRFVSHPLCDDSRAPVRRRPDLAGTTLVLVAKRPSGDPQSPYCFGLMTARVEGDTVSLRGADGQRIEPISQGHRKSWDSLVRAAVDVARR